MLALIKPGDTILGLYLAHGGHLTHGMKINFSGKLYNVAAYQVARGATTGSTWTRSSRLAREHRPEADHRRLVRLPAAARLRGASARSPTRSAPT